MKLDVTSIEGYADMSAEEKVKALEGFEYDDNSSEVERYKNATTKANSEAAEYKRQLKALQEKASEGQTDSEKQMAELKSQIEALTKEKIISESKASFLTLGNGMNDDSAATLAEAFTNGDSDNFFKAMKDFITEHDKAFKAELLKSTPRPGEEGGKTPAPMKKEDFKKLSPAERAKFYTEHPDEYKKIYGG